jgi:dihydrofolate reductase
MLIFPYTNKQLFVYVGYMEETPSTPHLIGIFASSNNNCIGCENQLPWHIPEDLTFFKKETTGHILIMGRNTYESLPNGGLSNRIHIVITSKPTIKLMGLPNENIHFSTKEDVYDLIETIARKYPEKRFYVIGGASTFQFLEPSINKYIVTHIHKHYDGDVFYNFDHSLFQYSHIMSEFYCEKEKCFITRKLYSRHSIEHPPQTSHTPFST